MNRAIFFLSLAVVSCGLETVKYESPKFAKIVSPEGASVRYSTDFASKIAKTLPSGALVTVVRETESKVTWEGYGKARLFKVRTRSGFEGWIFGSFISFVDEDSFRQSSMAELELYDIFLRQAILDTVSTWITRKNLHPMSKIEGVKFDTVSHTGSSTICEANVSVFMIGNLLGWDKYEVGLKVYVQLLDIDYLSAAGLRISQLSIVTDRKVDGLSWTQKYDQLKPFLPILKSLIGFGL